MKILLLTPELFGFGGVQRFSRHVSLVLGRLAEVNQFQLLINSLMDKDIDNYSPYLPGNPVILISKGNKIRFVFNSLRIVSPKMRWIYATHLHLSPVAYFIKRINSSVKYAVHLHGIDIWGEISPLRKMALQNADLLTTSSTFTAEKALSRHRLSAEKIRVLNPPIDPFWLQKILNHSSSLESGKENKGKYLLTVARLDAADQQKGVDDVIRAFSLLSPKYPDLRYRIVGTGSDQKRLEELAKKSGLGEKVIFLGNVTEGELQELYKNCEIFIMPSKKEGLGIVFLEAMAYKKPIIACDEGGIPDAVISNQTGILVNFGRPDEIKKAVERLITEPETAAMMGEAGYHHLLDKFSFETFCRKISKNFDLQQS